MTYKFLKTTTEKGIRIITINREDKLNALNIRVIDELGKAFKEVYQDRSVSGVILTGSGKKAFAAGADIAEFEGFSREEGKQMSQNGHDVFKTIERCPKPVIAAINGFALGGGCELAMACHLRVASINSRFGQPEVKLGIIPGYGGTQRLVQLIGKAKALELMMTADMISANDALQLGLVNYVTEPADLISKCKELLIKIQKNGPLAVAKVISCVNAFFDNGVDGFSFEVEQFADCMDTNDFREGTSAFLEKRKANFSGK